jgi:hypothetical protein
MGRLRFSITFGHIKVLIPVQHCAIVLRLPVHAFTFYDDQECYTYTPSSSPLSSTAKIIIIVVIIIVVIIIIIIKMLWHQSMDIDYETII